MEQQTLDLVVAILAEGAVAEEARRLRSEVAGAVETNPLYSLDSLPHVTLYQGRYPFTALEQIKTAIAETLTESTAPLMEFSEELYLAKASSNVFWNLRRSPELEEFHMRFVEALNPLRSGLMLSRYLDKLEHPDTPQEQKEVLEKYGYSYIGEHFLPHFTLVKLNSNDDFAAVADLSIASSMNATASTVVLGKIGYAGDLLGVMQDFRAK